MNWHPTEATRGCTGWVAVRCDELAEIGTAGAPATPPDINLEWPAEGKALNQFHPILRLIPHWKQEIMSLSEDEF